jgi:uncharacterized protein (DUF488 family)
MWLYTIGYQGLAIGEFIDLLLAHQVQTLVDVRGVPLSRKRGFSKRALAAVLAQHGISYQHVAALGCPQPSARPIAATATASPMSGRYGHLAGQRPDLEELARQAQVTTCCLLCFEANAAQCHRALVADQVADIAAGALTVRHITASGG